MIIATYDEQRSFPEYVDMTFKDLVVVDSHVCPVWDWQELYELIVDGYAFDSSDVYVPTDIEPVFGNMGRLNGVSKRRFKIFCKRTFEKHGGTQEDLDEIAAKHENELEEIERFYTEFVGPEQPQNCTFNIF